MKKRARVILLLVLSAVLIFALNYSVFAASTSTTATLAGVRVTAYNSISSQTATAYTFLASDSGVLDVSATYYYINITTMESDDEYRPAESPTHAQVSFTAPSGCRSVKIRSWHYAYFSGQSWRPNELQSVY